MKFHIEYWVVIPDIYISDISDNCVKVITKVCSNHDNHPIMGPEKKIFLHYWEHIVQKYTEEFKYGMQ